MTDADILTKYLEIEAEHGGIAVADAEAVARETAEACGVDRQAVRDALAADLAGAVLG